MNEDQQNTLFDVDRVTWARCIAPSDEFALYETDRKAWAALVAPRWRVMLAAADEAAKAELWKLAGPELRGALRDLKNKGAVPA